MARTTKNTAKTSAPARKRGRPSNAEVARRDAAAQRGFLDIVTAAASAAAQGAVAGVIEQMGGIPNGVTTLSASTPSQSQPSQSQPSQSAPSQSATAKRTGGTGSGSRSTSNTSGRAGRPVNPNSNRAKAFGIYDKMAGDGKERADIVDKMVADLGLQRNVANTYFHEAAKKAGNAKSTGGRRTSTRKSTTQTANAA